MSRHAATEGASCTRSAFKARNKGFMFLGQTDASYNVMLKLDALLPEALELAETNPDHYKVGKTGWATATFDNSKAPPRGVMPRWIDESFRLLAPKQLVTTLPAAGTKKKTAKK
jgi:hypothetical protein